MNLPVVPTGASRYACTCGYELRGLELERFLARADADGVPPPAAIRCPKCSGVAVRRTGAQTEPCA